MGGKATIKALFCFGANIILKKGKKQISFNFFCESWAKQVVLLNLSFFGNFKSIKNKSKKTKVLKLNL